MQRERHNLPSHLPEDLVILLGRLAVGLKDLYGERYRGLVLYGSYARGDADEGSDVDLLLLLDGEVETTREIPRAESVKWLPAMELGYAVSLIPLGEVEFSESGQPFLNNARREGVLLD